MTTKIIHYSENQIKKLSNKELLQLIESFNKTKKGLSRFLKTHHPIIFDEIVNRTNFLVNKNIIIFARLYCLKHDILEQPVCRRDGCSNIVNWRNTTNQFALHCSSKCAHNNPETYEKTKHTCLERTGYENPGQSPEAKEKRIKTNNEKYGVDNVYQSEEIKKKIRVGGFV